MLHLSVERGAQELLRFATEPQLRRLADWIAETFGLRLRAIQVHAPGQAPGTAGPGTPAALTPPSPPPAAGRSTGDRQAALNLPLVRYLLDHFDVTVVDVRPEYNGSEVDQGPGAKGEGPEEDASDADAPL